MKYEVFWNPKSPSGGCDIEADSEEEAKEIFLEMVRDNAEEDELIANCLGDDTDSEEDEE